MSPALVSRRELLQKFLGALGTALAGAQVASAHPVHRHLRYPDGLLDDASAKVDASDWKPEVLDPQQNETLIILSERILPGSSGGQTNRLIDLLLTVESPENRKNFLNGMKAIDSEAQRRFHQPFRSLVPAQQDEILALCSTAKAAKVATDRETTLEEDRAPIPGGTIRDHFENLKGWIVGAYYSSELGMRELGWTEENYFDDLPECAHPEEHR